MIRFPEELSEKIRASIDAEALLHRINYRTETIQAGEGQIRCFCPIHREQIFSNLTIDPVGRTYVCGGNQCSGRDGGDLVDLYAKSMRIDRDEALIDLALTFGVGLDPQITADYIKQAQEIGDNLMLMGVFDEAEKQYERVLRVAPDFIPALKHLHSIREKTGESEKLIETALQLAQALANSGDHEAATKVIRDYIPTSSADASTRKMYIDCLKKLGRQEEAVQEAMSFAQDMKDKGDVEEALRLYRSIQDLRSQTSDVSARIVQTLISSGRADEAVVELVQRSLGLAQIGKGPAAIDCLHTALDIQPERDDLRVRIAEIIARENLAGQPLADYCQMIEVMIRNQANGPAAQALNTLRAAFPDNTNLYELKGDLEEARGHAEAALESRLHCVDLCEQKTDYEGALNVLDKLLRHQPGETTLLSRRAGALLQVGRRDDAAQAYLEIIHQFEAAGDYEQAAAAYQAVIDLQPAEVFHRERQFELYRRTMREPIIVAKAQGLARIYQDRGENAKAVKILTSIISMSGLDDDFLTLHAESLESLGRRHEAAQQYLDAAQTAFKREDYDAARQRLEHSLRCMPEHMDAREMHADVLLKQSNTAHAINEYCDLGQFYLRAAEPENVLRLAKKVQEVQPDHLPMMQLMLGAYDHLGQMENKRALQLRLVQIYRRQQSYTMASELCESMLNEDEDFTPAIEQLVAITENTRQSVHAIEFLWKLAQAHSRGGQHQEEKRVVADILTRNTVHPEATLRHLELLSHYGTAQELAGAVDQTLERFIGASRHEELLRILNSLKLGTNPKPETITGLVRLHQLMGDDEGVKDALRTQAQLLARALRDPEAIEVWGQLAKIQPEDVGIRRMRIELMLRSDQKKRAIEEYRFLANHYKQRSLVDDSEAALQEILRLMPDDRRARESLVSIHIEREIFPEAIREIETMASHEVRKGDLNAAVRAYERVFEFDPRSEETFQKIIALKKRLGDIPGALNYYLGLLEVLKDDSRSGTFEKIAYEAMALAPTHWEIRVRLADLLIGLGRNIEGEGVLTEMAVMQIKAGDLNEASTTIERLLTVNPDSVRGRALNAELMAMQGNKEGALNKFMELADSLGEGRGMPTPQPPMFNFGNYEGLTRVKEYTFDQFVVGSRNNFAHASAVAVSRAPGKNYNPLFLYADVGLGKTHLCHSIANHVLEHHPQLKVFYTMTEDFMEALIDSIQNNTVSAFRNRHRNSDVLIIDDIQFLSGKERAQEEFFHIFNALYEGGKQIVITSDRPPKNIAHLENRLRSRFGAGVIVDIQTPDLETRIAIIRRELIQRGRNNDVSDETVLMLAECIPSNIRDLKGALIQVLARHDATQEAIDTRMIQNIVDLVMDRV